MGWHVESSRGKPRSKLSTQARMAQDSTGEDGGSARPAMPGMRCIQTSLKDVQTLERLGKYLLCTGSSMEVLAEEWMNWPHGGPQPQGLLIPALTHAFLVFTGPLLQSGNVMASAQNRWLMLPEASP